MQRKVGIGGSLIRDLRTAQRMDEVCLGDGVAAVLGSWPGHAGHGWDARHAPGSRA